MMATQLTEWRTIANFPDYAVSSQGFIKRVKPGARNHRLSDKPLRPAVSPGKKYPSVTLCRAGLKFNIRVNRVVCETFHGPAPSLRHHAAHNDGDPANNCAANLRWATAVENEADKKRHGTALIGDNHWSVKRPDLRAKGERHGLAKLTPDDVRKIRQDGRFQRVIAADFSVTQRVIWSIKAGKTWGHVA